MAKEDPHLWLEEVSGEKCLHWAKEPLASWDSWEVKRRDEILGKMPTTKGWQRKVRTGSSERISQGPVEPLNIYKPVDCLVQSHTTYSWGLFQPIVGSFLLSVHQAFAEDWTSFARLNPSPRKVTLCIDGLILVELGHFVVNRDGSPKNTIMPSSYLKPRRRSRSMRRRSPPNNEQQQKKGFMRFSMRNV